MSERVTDGWHEVDGFSRIRYQGGEPVEASTHALNLDRAENNIEQYHGSPLEFGQWRGNGAAVEECFVRVSLLEEDGDG